MEERFRRYQRIGSTAVNFQRMSEDPFWNSRASSLREPTRHGELIEDWPTSPDRCCEKGAVRFASRSCLHIFEKTTPVNELYYTSTERSVISKRDTVQEAIRIRKLLRDGIAASGEDVPTLAQCGLQHEELVGLEHLVLSKVPTKISKIRKHHAQKVLKEQGNQKAALRDDASQLAKVSATSSNKSSVQAWRRAVVALGATDVN